MGKMRKKSQENKNYKRLKKIPLKKKDWWSNVSSAYRKEAHGGNVMTVMVSVAAKQT